MIDYRLELVERHSQTIKIDQITNKIDYEKKINLSTS